MRASILAEGYLESRHMLSRSNNCELFFVATIILMVLFWASAVSLFSKGKWRKKYYRWVFLAVISGTILASFLVHDAATLYILVTPSILDICIVGCRVIDIFQEL
jgi:uncharacterized membrane protein (DUF2068 family)